MITRIELDGFKTFDRFAIELAPLQVIVGANGVGKSNLFDALRLLSRLVDDDLRSAFAALRGDAEELFTVRPDGTARIMRFAVELLVEQLIRDSWGDEARITFTRLRYELQVARNVDQLGLERLNVTHESLAPIARGEDTWLKRHGSANLTLWQPVLKAGRRTAFISTQQQGEKATISLHQDGHGGRKASVAERIERTVLSGVTNTEFPHAFAAREEMRSWTFLHLNPEVLRQPSPMLAHTTIAADGGNLPNALVRMRQEDPMLLHDVARDLANLVPGIVGICVDEDVLQRRYIVQAQTQDGRTFSSRVLSDGTLRLLALAALTNDPAHHGVLCFEEPENGLHPGRLDSLAHLLQGLATDFTHPDQAQEPLRQLLVNTHSPLLISQAGLVQHVLFAHTVTRLRAQTQPPLGVTRIVPVVLSRQLKLNMGIEDQEIAYTLDQVIHYLENADSEEAIAALRREALG